MKIISIEDKYTQSSIKESGVIELKKNAASPAKALELVFGEYSPNTQRAYARAFRNFQDWADIRELHEILQILCILRSLGD